jgi:hypothetical protein
MGTHGNGKEAARYLAWMGFKGMVIIHSVNEDGAKAMNTVRRMLGSRRSERLNCNPLLQRRNEI